MGARSARGARQSMVIRPDMAFVRAVRSNSEHGPGVFAGRAGSPAAAPSITSNEGHATFPQKISNAMRPKSMGVWQNAVPLEKEIKDRQAQKNVSDAPLERQILDKGLSGDRLEALRAPNPRQQEP